MYILHHEMYECTRRNIDQLIIIVCFVYMLLIYSESVAMGNVQKCQRV